MGWVLTLGTTHDLCLWEAGTVLGRCGISAKLIRLNQIQYLLDREELPDQRLIRELGGTVKISRVVAELPLPASPVQIADVVTPGRNKWAISANHMPVKELTDLAKQIKASQKGQSSHFRVLSNPQVSSGIVSKYEEWQVIQGLGKAIVARVTAVQDIDRWNLKDYSRPKANARSGMLPPKVARMMLNIALRGKIIPEYWVYDPFCGSGTILVEGMDLGLSVIGSDINRSAVEGASDNCRWYTEHNPLNTRWQVFQADAALVHGNQLPGKPDAVVYEGYLGPANLLGDRADNMLRGLTKLYIGVWKNLAKLIDTGTMMVCALPEYHYGVSVKTLHRLVDSCEKYGYTLLRPPISYGRKSAKIRRSIVALQRS